MDFLKSLILVFQFFQLENSNYMAIKKTYLWFTTNNPMLGGKAINLVKIGRSAKLLKIIQNLLAGDIA